MSRIRLTGPPTSMGKLNNSQLMGWYAHGARCGVRQALRGVGRAALGAANPRRMFQHHPAGTGIAIGVIVAGGVARIAAGRGRSWTVSLLAYAARAAGKALFATLTTRALYWASLPAQSHFSAQELCEP